MAGNGSVTRRRFLGIAAGATVAGLSACSALKRPAQGQGSSAPEGSAGSSEEPKIDLKEFAALELDMDAWSFDAQNGCWYQLGIPYCTKPATESYESLAIFVPGAYLTGEKHGRAYRCTVADDATVGSFTPATAPVVMPINSANFEAQACPTSYSYEGIGRYLAAGLVYVYAGFRGRSSTVESGSSEMIAGGAPWALVDLKAAVRYLRYNKDLLPCDTDQVYTFGYGGGGGVSACLGAMGDAPVFDDYLASIGAATHDGVEGAALSDALAGSASWSPLLSFDRADAAYEWMMGQFSDEGDRAEGTWTRLLSADLAAAYGKQLNDLALVDADGNPLSLDAAEDGSYVSGTYYDYIIKLVEDSATAFLSQTSFPYTYTPPLGGTPTFPGDPNLTAANEAAEGTAAETASTDVDAAGADADGEAVVAAPTVVGVTQVQSTVFDSIESYVGTLNGDARWLTYNSRQQMADVTDLWSFVAACRPATRGVGAYDSYDRSTVVNQLFGIGDETTLHFDATMAELVAGQRNRYREATGWQEIYVSDWGGDLVKKDSFGIDMATRTQMSDPLAYLSDHYESCGTSKVAPHWRINTGLFSSETPLVSEVNLALALAAYDGVGDVALNCVWGASGGLAEQAGNATDNLISWVTSCVKPKDK